MTKVKVTFVGGVVRSAKAATVEAAVAKVMKYAQGAAVASVEVAS